MRTARWLALVPLLALAAGCAAPRLTPQLAAEMAYQSVGPNMRLGEDLVMVWVPGARDPVSAAVARSALPMVGADSPMVTNLARVMAPAARAPVNIAVSGDDSAFAARVATVALSQVSTELPHLRLVFVGKAEHTADLAQAMAARRGTFYFEPAP